VGLSHGIEGTKQSKKGNSVPTGNVKMRGSILRAVKQTAVKGIPLKAPNGGTKSPPKEKRNRRVSVPNMEDYRMFTGKKILGKLLKSGKAKKERVAGEIQLVTLSWSRQVGQWKKPGKKGRLR